MSTPEQNTGTTWIQEVDEADIAQEKLLRDAEEIADRRALAIARGVAESGRGGREAVAAQLGTRVGAVDKALSRARGAAQPGYLPFDLLDRLLSMELNEITPLTASQWRAVHWLVRATVVDVTWLDDPASLLAAQVEEAELEGVDTAGMGKVIRSWSRVQAIAVLETLRQNDSAEVLPARG
ncbi:hypothetical protein ACFXKW_21090 [Streptomyces sp. NPDC059193]|uniref:hypothetical protein n=1 Tax=Streptomyces sp. NPDC059193 TaxID=3346763 RepID=UPI003687AB3D